MMGKFDYTFETIKNIKCDAECSKCNKSYKKRCLYYKIDRVCNHLCIFCNNFSTLLFESVKDGFYEHHEAIGIKTKLDRYLCGYSLDTMSLKEYNGDLYDKSIEIFNDIISVAYKETLAEIREYIDQNEKTIISKEVFNGTICTFERCETCKYVSELKFLCTNITFEFRKLLEARAMTKVHLICARNEQAKEILKNDLKLIDDKIEYERKRHFLSFSLMKHYQRMERYLLHHYTNTIYGIIGNTSDTIVDKMVLEKMKEKNNGNIQ